MYCTIPLGCDFFAPIRFAKDPSGTVLVRRRLLLFSSYLRDFVVHRNFLGLSFFVPREHATKNGRPSCRLRIGLAGNPAASLPSQSLFIEIHTQT